MGDLSFISFTTVVSNKIVNSLYSQYLGGIGSDIMYCNNITFVIHTLN